MPNDQTNAAETTLRLCYLMRDLEILGFELLVTEEAEGRPVGTSPTAMTSSIGWWSDGLSAQLRPFRCRLQPLNFTVALFQRRFKPADILKQARTRQAQEIEAEGWILEIN
jgi:hypothetical protein